MRPRPGGVDGVAMAGSSGGISNVTRTAGALLHLYAGVLGSFFGIDITFHERQSESFEPSIGTSITTRYSLSHSGQRTFASGSVARSVPAAIQRFVVSFMAV